MHLTFEVTDTASPSVKELPRMASSSAALRAGGRGVRNVVVNHLRNMPPNKAGFPSTGFYKSAADRTTQPEVEGNGVSISITQIGMRQRYFGGDINPIAGKYLTIPAIAQSYGTRAGEFDFSNLASHYSSSLKFAFVQDEQGFMRPALVGGDQGAGISGAKKTRRKKGDPPKPPIDPGQVVFWLVRHVHQEPDDSVLPTDAEIQGGFVSGIRSYIRAKLHDPNAIVEIAEEGNS